MEDSLKEHALYEKKLIEVCIVEGKTALHSFSDMRCATKSEKPDTINRQTFPVAINILMEMTIESELATNGSLMRLNKTK